ncbi:hypothetical protein [Rubripirellula lacrimiformis]|nr:hypothetical protein [Rubripirellula lacrimiformis]
MNHYNFRIGVAADTDHADRIELTAIGGVSDFFSHLISDHS